MFLFGLSEVFAGALDPEPALTLVYGCHKKKDNGKTQMPERGRKNIDGARLFTKLILCCDFLQSHADKTPVQVLRNLDRKNTTNSYM